jgi:arylsulfatase A-like enzyme
VLSWLDHRERRPFFAFLNYCDTHEPYDAAPPFDLKFSPTPTLRDRYDGALASMDHEVQRLLEGLRARGELDRTLVIVTADHGELFGEHQINGHHSSLYFDVLHVPLIMRYPGHVPADHRVSQPVSLRDLAATIVDVTGVGADGDVPGVSLAATWRDSTARGSPLFSAVERGVRADSTLPFAHGDMVSLIDGGWHYIRNNGTHKEQLYRFAQDPEELTDLLDEADTAATRLRGAVGRIIEGASGRAGSPH